MVLAIIASLLLSMPPHRAPGEFKRITGTKVPTVPDQGLLKRRCGTLLWAKNRFPLKVAVQENAYEWAPIVEAMVRWYGEEIFVYTHNPSKADVVFVGVAVFLNEAQTWPKLDRRCRILNSTIGVPLTIRVQASWIVVHELGHVLGLAHDGNRQSVMYPFYNVAKLLEQDRDLIFKTYGVQALPSIIAD